MVRDEYCGNRHWIYSFKGANDGRSGICFVLASDLFVGHHFCQGNRAVKIVGVRAAEARNRLAGLGPRRGVFGMRVCDSADGRKCAIQGGMRWKIRKTGAGAPRQLFRAGPSQRDPLASSLRRGHHLA